jgi:chromosome segregation ATPase
VNQSVSQMDTPTTEVNTPPTEDLQAEDLQAEDLQAEDLQAEVIYLRQQLQAREQLVQQLSAELCQVMVNHPTCFLDSEEMRSPTSSQEEQQALRQQVQELEAQISFYQGQISHRDLEINQLRDSVHDLSDRNDMLQKVVQELPEVYRQKFSERLAQVKAKLQALQRENLHLQAQLQGAGGKLAVRSAPPENIDLATFPPLQANGMSTSGSYGSVFGN